MLLTLVAIASLNSLLVQRQPADSTFVSLVAGGTEATLEVGHEVVRIGYPKRGLIHRIPGVQGTWSVSSRYSVSRNKWLVSLTRLYEVDGRTGVPTELGPAILFAYTTTGVLRISQGGYINQDPDSYYLSRNNVTRKIPAIYGRPHGLTQDGKTIISVDDRTYQHYLLAVDANLVVKKFKTLNLPDSYADTTVGSLDFLAPATFVYIDGTSFGASQVIRITVGPKVTESEVLFSIGNGLAPSPFWIGNEILITRRDTTGWSLTLVGRKTVRNSKFVSKAPPRIRLNKSGKVLVYKDGRWQSVEWRPSTK